MKLLGKNNIQLKENFKLKSLFKIILGAFIFSSEYCFADKDLFVYCQSFQELSSNENKSTSIIEKEKISLQKIELIKLLSEKIVNSYFTGELEPLRNLQKIERTDLYSYLQLSCLDKLTKERIDLHLQEDFQKFSAETINNFGPKNSKFVDLILSDKIQYFRLLGHFKDAPPDGKKGGFHRGQKSIYMNFLKMNPNEWFVIFIHEHLHALDKTLIDSLEIYGDEGLTQTLKTYKKQNLDFNKWEQSVKDKLLPWLIAGLDRGFLAEYRAWTVTVELYLEARNNNKIHPILWLDKILKQRKTNESISSFMIKFLSPKWIDPKEELFSYAPIQKTLLQVRKNILLSSPPSLGKYLEEIIN
ncbi:MAG: hypothetical protein L6Q37_07620 [Bdellovibrionaceae bacterium]|nr:hypothetical protein [Pseudobdellovibrionaceae bacterium]NUM60311.1 hypothetical protein [Pseudobdellovibrionaceae bacterium]